ncbi:hypothetical protein GCM10009828_087490 [Actinoplanes couchii]
MPGWQMLLVIPHPPARVRHGRAFGYAILGFSVLRLLHFVCFRLLRVVGCIRSGCGVGRTAAGRNVVWVDREWWFDARAVDVFLGVRPGLPVAGVHVHGPD